MQRGWGIARLPHPQPSALSSAQTTQAGRAGPRGAPPQPGWHRSCHRHARCSPLRNTRRWLSQGCPGPPSSPGHSGGGFPAWPCHHGCWVVAACRGGGASALGWAEPRTEGWFAGVRAAQKQGLANLSLRLELRFPSAVLGVEPCSNSLVNTGKHSRRSRRCLQPAWQTQLLRREQTGTPGQRAPLDVPNPTPQPPGTLSLQKPDLEVSQKQQGKTSAPRHGHGARLCTGRPLCSVAVPGPGHAASMELRGTDTAGGAPWVV